MIQEYGLFLHEVKRVANKNLKVALCVEQLIHDKKITVSKEEIDKYISENIPKSGLDEKTAEFLKNNTDSIEAIISQQKLFEASGAKIKFA
ncbi:hypothetical protein FACS189496_5490 [Bacilli bacterium]|nr:hypothetical protein FACS189496_5490 [Bacilli bacterium]